MSSLYGLKLSGLWSSTRLPFEPWKVHDRTEMREREKKKKKKKGGN